MSGSFHPRVTFPLYTERAKTGRIDIEPFFSLHGYGTTVRVVHQLVGGCGKSKYLYERVVEEDAMLRKLIPTDGNEETWEMFSEYFEGFYHNKISQDVLVPITALLLTSYFSYIVDKYNVDLSEYITEVTCPEDKRMGFENR